MCLEKRCSRLIAVGKEKMREKFRKRRELINPRLHGHHDTFLVQQLSSNNSSTKRSFTDKLLAVSLNVRSMRGSTVVNL